MLINPLAIGLLKEPAESVASQIAMWDEIEPFRLALKKLHEKVFKARPVVERLKDVADSLKNYYPPEELRLMLLFRLAAHLGIAVPPDLTVKDLDDVANAIADKAVQIWHRTHKSQRVQSQTEQDMVREVVREMLGAVQKQFQKASGKERENVLNEVMRVIESMPDDYKERLRENIQAERLTREAVAKALVTGTFSIGLTALVEVAGFSAYTFAVQALAAMAGLFGITLPFSVYVYLTSSIAVLTNPLFFVPALAFMTYTLSTRARRKIRDHLVPMVVTQGILSSAIEGDFEAEAERVIECHRKLRRKLKSPSVHERVDVKNRFPGIARYR